MILHYSARLWSTSQELLGTWGGSNGYLTLFEVGISKRLLQSHLTMLKQLWYGCAEFC